MKQFVCLELGDKFGRKDVNRLYGRLWELLNARRFLTRPFWSFTNADHA